MASHFDRWEKDPFFSAAEEVQESADRMESTYRTWLYSKKDSSGTLDPEEIRRDLRTALGTAKWQLEEFDRAVKPSHVNSSAEGAKERHNEFIVAIESQVSKVESSLHKSSVSDGKPPRPWVHLNEGERDELALFLSRPASASSLEPIITQSTQNCRDCSLHPTPKTEEEGDKLTGHRRTASAGADIGAWKISVGVDVGSRNENREPSPRKIPSFSGFLNKMETTWSSNGYRKLKNTDHHQEADNSLSQSQELTRGIKDCYGRRKGCLDGCDDKELYGWYGAIHRLVQRSQYQLQYSRPFQVIFWIFLLVCLIGLIAMNAI